MLSNIFISGRLAEKIGPKTRIVEIDRVIPGPTGRYSVDRIPVKSTLSYEGQFMKANVGAFIVLKGRLETNERGELIVVDEIDEILPSLGKKRGE